MSIRAVVRNGRLIVEEPTTLPEGTILDLVVDDGGDDLDDTERAALHARLDASSESARAGRGRPAAELLKRLRKKG